MDHLNVEAHVHFWIHQSEKVFWAETAKETEKCLS
jgi:hypothetical protein